MHRHSRNSFSIQKLSPGSCLPWWLWFLSRSGTTKLAPSPLALCRGEEITPLPYSVPRIEASPDQTLAGGTLSSWDLEQGEAAHSMFLVRAKCLETSPLLISAFLSPKSGYISSGLMFLLIKLHEKTTFDKRTE